MSNDWWIDVVKWILLIAIAFFYGRWYFKHYRFQLRPSPGGNALRQPLRILLWGAFGFIFFGGAAVGSNTIWKNETTTIWTTLGFLFFALISLAIIIYYFPRFHLSPAGLDYPRLLGKRGYTEWSEIQRVKYRSWWGWFQLQTEAGATIMIPASLLGLSEFAQQVLTHVSEERIDRSTKALLKEIAVGKRPEIWK